MTNEELITGLRHIAHTMERNGHSYYQHIAEDAIKALEQQPCEDCISRQQALDCFEQTNTRQGAKYAIETLPSVKPKYTDEEIDRAQAVEQAYVDKMVELAVEESKRPKGMWIVDKKYTSHFSGGHAVVYSVHCSECNYFSTDNMYRMPYKFCPNCGAYMGGEEDDTDCD